MTDKATQEEVFKNGLDALVTITEALQPYCETIQDLVGMAKLALSNEAQLRLLMKQVETKQLETRRR